MVASGFTGVAIGYALKAWIGVKKAALEIDLKSWRARLDSALTADEATAKRAVTSVLAEIKAKL
jgi:hypothetical protein